MLATIKNHKLVVKMVRKPREEAAAKLNAPCTRDRHVCLSFPMQLLDHGADVHYMNLSGKSAGTALHEAAARNNDKLCELLMQCECPALGG
jgi:hypothetical protein